MPSDNCNPHDYVRDCGLDRHLGYLGLSYGEDVPNHKIPEVRMVLASYGLNELGSGRSVWKATPAEVRRTLMGTWQSARQNIAIFRKSISEGVEGKVEDGREVFTDPEDIEVRFGLCGCVPVSRKAV